MTVSDAPRDRRTDAPRDQTTDSRLTERSAGDVLDDHLDLREVDDGMRIGDGVDSFPIEGGKIHVQTIRYTATFSDLSQARGF